MFADGYLYAFELTTNFSRIHHETVLICYEPVVFQGNLKKHLTTRMRVTAAMTSLVWTGYLQGMLQKPSYIL